MIAALVDDDQGVVNFGTGKSTLTASVAGKQTLPTIKTLGLLALFHN